jgi:hypothetical protein
MWKELRGVVLAGLLSGLPLLLLAQRADESAACRSPEAKLSGFLPESGIVGHWDRKTTPTLYTPENLWEYINGAAEHYLSYGFQRLATAEYGLSQNPDAAVVVDIYDMGDGERGFGIYSSERQPSYDFVDIGTQGYLGDLALNFYAGPYYVKLSTFEVSDEMKAALKAFGKEVARRMKEKRDFPAALRHLPASRIPSSEKMIYRNFLGQPYLQKVWLADCTIPEPREAQHTVSLFWTSFEDPKTAHQAFEKLKTSDVSSGAPVSALNELGEENFWVATKYHGVLVVVRKGTTLLGGYDFQEAKAAIPLLKEMH